MLTVGQSWVSASGVMYTIEEEIKGGYSVSVRDEEGPVTASDGRWNFTPTKLRNLIKAQGLKLYDASAALDRIAERLEEKKLVVLAARVDAIANEYVEARHPARLRDDRARHAEEQLKALEEQLEDARDPENRDRIILEIENTISDIESLEERLSEVNRTDPIDPVSKPANVGRTGGVSKP